MTQMAGSPTSMSINNNLLAKVPIWQGFSGRNRLKFHSIRVRRTPERLPSDGFIERAPQPFVPFHSSREGAPRRVTERPCDRSVP
jgi:hypothetical protein